MDSDMMDELLPALVPVAVYWIASGLYYVLLNSRDEHRLFTKGEEVAQNLATPKQVVLGVLACHALQTVLAVFQFTFLRRHIRNGGSPQPVSLLRVIGQMAAATLVLDAWEYFCHRLMHENNFLYKHVHSLHHRLRVPYAYGGQYQHLLDFFLGPLLGNFVSLAIIGMSPRTATVFFSIQAFKSVDDHCSRWFPSCNPFHRFLGNNAAFHAVHHQLHGFKHNYSVHFLTIWDILLGTYLPYSVVKRNGGGYEIRTARDE